MRKILIIMMLALGAASAGAQGVRHGAEAGIDLSKAINSSGDAQAAFNVGYRFEYGFGKGGDGWYLRSGLGLHYKPGKDSSVLDGGDEGYVSENLRYSFKPYYMQLPAMAGYRLKLSAALKLQIETGPYLAIGLWGKSRITDAKTGKSTEYDCFGDNGLYKRVNCGWGFAAALQVRKHLQLGIGYSIDFNTADHRDNLYNQTTGLRVAWMF